MFRSNLSLNTRLEVNRSPPVLKSHGVRVVVQLEFTCQTADNLEVASWFLKYLHVRAYDFVFVFVKSVFVSLYSDTNICHRGN